MHACCCDFLKITQTKAETKHIQCLVSDTTISHFTSFHLQTLSYYYSSCSVVAVVKCVNI